LEALVQEAPAIKETPGEEANDASGMWLHHCGKGRKPGAFISFPGFISRRSTVLQ
jgi:hypothetical protein